MMWRIISGHTIRGGTTVAPCSMLWYYAHSTRMDDQYIARSSHRSSSFGTEAIDFMSPSPLGIGSISGDVEAFRRAILVIFKLQNLLFRSRLVKESKEAPHSVSKTAKT
jgi:hypothetical protein